MKFTVSSTSTDFVNTKRTAKENITVKRLKIIPHVRTLKTATKYIQKFAKKNGHSRMQFQK